VSRYEAFLKRFPDHGRARAELAGKLNGMAWNMVTAAKGSAGYNPKLGLKYALRAVELLPDANAYDTAIEAYLANGMKADALRICREALVKYPDEKMLQDRLKKMEQK
jgi:tetratricopeptide (TPR) repeat protein